VTASGSSPRPATAAPWWAPPGALAVLLVATAVTVALALPVLRAPGERVFGDESIGRYHDPYTVMAWFERPTAPRTTTQPATDYPGALVARWTGGVAAYDVVVLATFPLAALFAYLFVFHLAGSRPAATIAALFYAFSPFHLAHAPYHPHIAQIQWLPLALLAIALALERASAGRLALLVGALALTALSNFYFGLVAGVLTPVAILAFRWTRPHEAAGGSRRDLVRVLATLAGAALLGLLYVALFAPRVLRAPRELAFPASDLARYTARWQSYLVPPIEHPLFGTAARDYWAARGLGGAVLEQQVTVGFALAAAALLAIVLWLRERRRWELRAVPGLALVGAAAFLCSLGPVWQLGAWSVPRPTALFHRLLPMFRAHARFGVVVGLAVAALAAIALVELWRRHGRGGRVVAAVFLLLATFELTPWPPWRWHDVLPTAAHRWLVEHPPIGPVRDCAADDDPAERWTPKLFGAGLALLPATRDCAEPGLPATLAALGSERLIVRTGSRIGAWVAARPLPHGLALEREFPDSWLLRVEARPAPWTLELRSGFYPRELRSDGSFRWMGASGIVALENRTGSPARVVVETRLHAFPGSRKLVIRTDGGGPPRTIEVGPTPAAATLGPFDLQPGGRLLHLSTTGPATVPDSLDGGGDHRPLTIAIWSPLRSRTKKQVPPTRMTSMTRPRPALGRGIAAGLFTALLLLSGAAGAESDASAHSLATEATTDLDLNLPKLRAFGIEVTGIPAAAYRDPRDPGAVSFRARPADALEIGYENGNMRVFGAAALRHEDGFRLQLQSGEEVDLSSFEVTGAAPPSLFAIRARTGETVFLAESFHPMFDSDRSHILFRNASLKISSWLAGELGRSELVGVTIGGFELFARVAGSPEILQACGKSVDMVSPVDVDLTSISNLNEWALEPGVRVAMAADAALFNNGPGTVEWYRAIDPDGPVGAHPFLVQQLYRIDADGTFRQIGQSDVKHAFYAVNWPGDSACAGCGGQLLYAGCSDTYSNQNNANRQYFGPRSEVSTHPEEWPSRWTSRGSHFDAFGATPPDDNDDYRSHFGADHDTFEHRLQVIESDLGVAGARYFVELWYATARDSDPWNNIAHREFVPTNVSGAWTFPFSVGALTTSGPAIDAWVDPASPGADALSTTVDTGDGLLRLASRATEVGKGSWRYDYALFNLDFDRRVDRFAVPAGGVTAMEFRGAGSGAGPLSAPTSIPARPRSPPRRGPRPRAATRRAGRRRRPTRSTGRRPSASLS